MKLDFIYIWLAFLVIALGIMSVVLLLMPVHAACLEETMNATGQGYHSLEVLPDIGNLTKDEAMVVLGPGHNFNLSKSGVITFQNGSTWSIVKCNSTKKDW
jgi:hypothetical protein